MIAGTALGIDVGSVRIGLARAAPGTGLAMPLRTVAAGPGALAEILAVIAGESVTEVYVGDPVRLDGRAGPAALAARAFAQVLADRCTPVPVRMVDERLSTVQSQAALREAGRNTRSARSVIDQAAAVVILQNALETQAATGRPAGTAVPPRGEHR